MSEAEVGLIDPHPVKDDAQLAGERDLGPLGASPFRDVHRPGFELGPSCNPRHASEKPKSDLYRDLLPRLNSGEVELLENSRVIAQLVGLERLTARGGRDSIDHGPGGHDDLAMQ